MSTILTILKRILIVIGIALAFTVGLFGAIYLSLRSSQTRVPDIVGKDRASAENAISDAGLNFRVRATRSTSDAKPDTVLIQLPHAGEIVKVGQTVAVDISRATADGQYSAPSNANTETSSKQDNNSSSNTSSNSNANAEKKATNRNANNSNANNKNANANANRLANRNQNLNVNHAANGNLGESGTVPPPRTNANLLESTPRVNTNRGAASPSPNRRPPVVAPTP
ncbi:MAG TPA: PASTA domain-containing protein [Pyrinomonadaceae bacterium]|nr:PASTA domain-containing protein [Pyrinomonadaceae bacterium]